MYFKFYIIYKKVLHTKYTTTINTKHMKSPNCVSFFFRSVRSRVCLSSSAYRRLVDLIFTYVLIQIIRIVWCMFHTIDGNMMNQRRKLCRTDPFVFDSRSICCCNILIFVQAYCLLFLLLFIQTESTIKLLVILMYYIISGSNRFIFTLYRGCHS